MSDTTSAAVFDGLRKHAKRWLKALRAGDEAALQRLERVLPKHGIEPGLREVQQALAREHGFASWAALKEHFELVAAEQVGSDTRIAEFLEHACIFSGELLDVPAKWRRAERILARHPEIATADIHTAVVCGELDHVSALLAADPTLVTKAGGPQQWPPLLFLCYGRLPNERAAASSAAIAELLLDAGADPNSFFVTRDKWRLRFTALTGVMGRGELNQPEHPRAMEIARLLLDRGASPNDSQGLYNTHLVGDDTRWLELLFSFGLDENDPVDWHATDDATTKPGAQGTILDYLLPQAAANGHVRRLRCLLERGADANARSIYDDKTCYQAALVAGRLDVADLLLRFGASRDPLVGRDEFLAACSLGDRGKAMALLRHHPEYLSPSDPLIEAATAGRYELVKLLLELGMDPNAPGRHAHRALHAACGDPRISRLLVDHGADPRARCFGGTPTSWARMAGNGEMARFHATHSRDILDAVMAGHVELATQLLNEDPARAHARSPSGDTPLHLLPEDPERARRLIDLLLEHGAEPSAKNNAGITPAQKLEAEGLDTIADLLETS
jgi:ankyrin repeat protein